jgi:hypothetical protein
MGGDSEVAKAIRVSKLQAGRAVPPVLDTVGNMGPKVCLGPLSYHTRRLRKAVEGEQGLFTRLAVRNASSQWSLQHKPS